MMMMTLKSKLGDTQNTSILIPGILHYLHKFPYILT